jgi:PAS domain S-box-containing protein
MTITTHAGTRRAQPRQGCRLPGGRRVSAPIRRIAPLVWVALALVLLGQVLSHGVAVGAVLGLLAAVQLSFLVFLRGLPESVTPAVFQHLIEKAPDFIEILDSDGSARYSSPSVRLLLGDSRKRSGIDIVHPDDRDRARATLEDLRREPGGLRSITLRALLPDGSSRTLDVTARNLLEEPSIRGIVVNSQDVTQRVEAEDALKRSEERFRALIEKASDAITVLDAGGRRVYVSPAAHRVMGYSDTELLGHTVQEVVHPDDAVLMAEAHERLLATPGASVTAQYRVRHRDGSWRWMEGTAHNLLHNPSIEGIVVNYRDITDRKEAEDRLRTLSQAAEQMAEQVLIADRDLRIEYVNPALEQATGYDGAELVGRPVRTLTSDELGEERYAALLAEVEAGRSFTTTVERRRKDGTTFQVEITVTYILDADGRILHVLSTGRDITERLRLEAEQRRLREEVEKAAEEWRLTFDAIESPVCVVGCLGKIARVNRAALAACGREDFSIVGRPLGSIGSGEPWSTAATLVGRVLESGFSQRAEIRDRRTERSWEIVATPLARPGRDDQVILVARDVTSTVDLQESLRRSETMSAMGSLVAGVAHEVRNPLFSISANLDAFEAELGPGEHPGEVFALLRTEVGRLSDLMRDLLEYGRPSRLEIERAPLGEVICRAVHSTAALAERSRVEVVTSVEDDLFLPVDRQRLEQVFHNLIQNALQHTPEGGRVAVDAGFARDDGRDMAICTVADSGPGFHAEDLPHVFDPFFSRRSGGTGLGLSIVARIVDEHGGDVRARNGAVSGAVVEVRLPISPALRQAGGIPATA